MKFHRFFIPVLVLCVMLGLFPRVCAAEDKKPEAEQAIIDACTYRRNADLSEYHITIQELSDLFISLYCTGQLPWYVSSSYSYTYSQESGFIAEFVPAFQPDQGDAITTYEETEAQILRTCVKPGMSQWQIALALHDYLILHSAYDDSLQKHLPYHLLTENTAVCSGYALAYQHLLLKAGIDCLYVVSDAMDHGWNLVKIDGKWYHVDVTWDDPSPNTPGLVDHSYFLLTDDQIKRGEKPHYDWDVQTPCTDTRFSDAFWRNVNSAIWYTSKDTCYLMRDEDYRNCIYRRDENTGEETLLYNEPQNNTIDIGYGNYRYGHHGLTLRDDRLWFNAMDKVMSVKLDGTGLQTEYEGTGDTYIYGFHAGEVSLDLALNSHHHETTPKTVPLSPSQAHKCSFTRTVQAPSCQAEGITVSSCSCGLEVKSFPTEIAPHDYAKKQASATYICRNCGHSYSEEHPHIPARAFLMDNLLYFILIGVAILGLLARFFRKR